MIQLQYRIGIAVFLLMFAVGCHKGTSLVSGKGKAKAVIVVDSNASYMERLAAKEVRRYVYIRTGELLPVESASDAAAVRAKSRIIIASKDKSLAKNTQMVALGPQGYCIKTVKDSAATVFIIGGDEVGTLYGAYRFAEQFGIRFDLHGDTIPDGKIAFTLPDVDIVEKPLFELRGIQPFHDFPEGPDWWNTDDYKAIIGQLPKLRMNFIGLHTYPDGHVGPEPTVWIGLNDDIGPDGKVTFSSRSSYHNTARGGPWGYAAAKTSEFCCGGSQLFDRDDFSSDVMKDIEPWPKDLDKRNALFNRTAAMLNESFTFAHKIGVKTCVGTETPLTIPKEIKKRFQDLEDPNDPAVVQRIYEAMFKRIMLAYPIDYYWLWTPENWTWVAEKPGEAAAVQNDLLIAAKAAKNVGVPFTLATCGWVLGPQSDRSLFDKVLPKEMPFSCINREVGKTPVEPQFADINGRPKWAIPWLEDDPHLSQPQLWAGRMRMDAAEAYKYGCTGLMGIHWRTRVLSPNVDALAQAAWDQTGFEKSMPSEIAPTKENPVIALGGKDANFPKNKIADTNDQELYRSIRLDPSGYRFRLPNGKYTVTLKFCEPQPGFFHKRLFGVKFQGREPLTKVDIFGKVGANRAIDFTFNDINVENNILKIDFIPLVDVPCVSAIAIEGENISRKINCGGSQYKDYMSDVKPYQRPRFMPVDDFYRDWALAEFGPQVADRAAAIFASQDGRLPEPSYWGWGPGQVAVNNEPWAKVSPQYAFVDELAALDSSVVGSANRERFEYWLNTFKYMRAMARVGCTIGELAAVVKDVNAIKDPAAQKEAAKTKILPIRKRLTQEWAQMVTCLLETVSNTGEMGTVSNLEQHSLRRDNVPTQYDKTLEKMLGANLPDDCQFPMNYSGSSRIFISTVRTGVNTGESLKLKIVVLSQKQIVNVILSWRHLGDNHYKQIPAMHVAQGVYEATIPAEIINSKDFEYFVNATTGDSKDLYWPASAPVMNHTVIIYPQ